MKAILDCYGEEALQSTERFEDRSEVGNPCAVATASTAAETAVRARATAQQAYACSDSSSTVVLSIETECVRDM